VRVAVAPLLAALRVLTNPNDDDAFRAVASGTSPPLDNATLDAIVLEAARVGGSLHAAARSLHASGGLLAMDGGSSPASARAAGSHVPPVAPLVGAARQAVHALLQRLDELRRSARTMPPAQLLASVMRSGLLAALNPDKPPHGAKVHAHSLARSLSAATPSRARHACCEQRACIGKMPFSHAAR
jgi:superfamily I DNA/RNA helicase